MSCLFLLGLSMHLLKHLYSDLYSDTSAHICAHCTFLPYIPTTSLLFLHITAMGALHASQPHGPPLLPASCCPGLYQDLHALSPALRMNSNRPMPLACAGQKEASITLLCWCLHLLSDFNCRHSIASLLCQHPASKPGTANMLSIVGALLQLSRTARKKAIKSNCE